MLNYQVKVQNFALQNTTLLHGMYENMNFDPGGGRGADISHYDKMNCSEAIISIATNVDGQFWTMTSVILEINSL